MKRSFGALCGTSWKSSWLDGENGFEWKNRYLDEQRSRALDFLFDVSKRKPIHDSIREYHNHTWGESAPIDRLRDAISDYDPDLRERKLRAGVMGDFYTASARADSDAHNALPEPDSEDVFSKVMHAQEVKARTNLERRDDAPMRESDSLCGAEDFADTLAHLSAEDLDLLADEFYPKTTHSRVAETEIMKDVMRCRKTMSPRFSYAKIPQQDRTTWSPWYLRHLTKPDGKT